MKSIKDIIKFINTTRKNNKFKWEKEGEELLKKIKTNNYQKKELKDTLSILLLTEEIPNNFVIKLWLTSAKIEEKINNNKDQYTKLVKAYDILLKNKHPLYLFLEDKIADDLNRSFDQNQVKITNDNIIQLKNILNAFTVRNATINYCQGFNIIGALFLQMTNFKEEESFYLFCRLLEEIIPYDYYFFGIGIEAEMEIVIQLLNKFEPEIYNHILKIKGCELILYGLITQIVTSLFSFKAGKNITIFFYTCMFGFFSLEEKKEDIYYYFYKAILAIFKTFKKEILKVKDDKLFSELLDMNNFSKERMQGIIYFTLFDESKESLDINYAKDIRDKCVNKIFNEKKLKFKFKNEQGLECNINYPVCLCEPEFDSKFYLSIYYTKGCIQKQNQNNNIIIENEDENILSDIIIERRKHYCQIKKLKKMYNNYTWEKEGKEIFDQISNNKINYDKKKIKEMLSILLLTQPIPKNIIQILWQSCTRLDEIINNNKGQYIKLIKAFDILIKNKHPFYIYIKNKIAKDLNRTFCAETSFKVEENIIKLGNILHSFTVRNVSLNYCQGLNTIAGYFLKTMDFSEEKAFYLFLVLLEQILPYDYYLFGIGVEIDLNVINIILRKYEKDLMEYLDKIQGNIIIIAVLTQFITSLFTFKMDENLTNILFNCFFGFFLLEEKKENVFFYFYKIIIGIFKSFKDELMNCKDFKDISKVFNFEKNLNKNIIENIIYYTLFQSENDFDLNEAKNIRQNELNKIISNRKEKFKFENKVNIKCNLNYPICVNECNTFPLQLKVTYEKINIKEDANNINNNEVKDNEENDEEILRDIIVERRNHFCQK